VSNLYFITGATGFIGQHFLRAEKLFCDPLKCVDIRVLSRKAHSKYETVICDLQADLIPNNALDGVDTIFHLAGFAHDVRDVNEIEDLYRKVNVDATVKLAELAVKSGVKRFVFVSSVKAGGIPPQGVCVSEESQSNLYGIYGETKRKAEIELLKIGKESGMHVSIIRPSLVYGPNVKGNLKLMLSGIKKGWFPPLPETGNKRSMIHVDDLVQAILLVAENKQANGEIFIATDGAPHSSREIYNAMCSAMGKSIPKWSVSKILFDIANLINPRIKYKLNKLLGDECYSSAKLEALGFKAKNTLKDMNETSF
jgi:UDP-glucose 4-epimerase